RAPSRPARASAIRCSGTGTSLMRVVLPAVRARPGRPHRRAVKHTASGAGGEGRDGPVASVAAPGYNERTTVTPSPVGREAAEDGAVAAGLARRARPWRATFCDDRTRRCRTAGRIERGGPPPLTPGERSHVELPVAAVPRTAAALRPGLPPRRRHPRPGAARAGPEAGGGPGR